MGREAKFKFYGNLNDFLRNKHKNEWLLYRFNNAPAVKDAIEALGVPHPEVDVIFINQKPANFEVLLQPQDEVEVHPVYSEEKFPHFLKLTSPLPLRPAFVLDVHLGKLAKALRLLGFDTVYQNNFTDAEIAGLAFKEKRIVLTRDIGLLKQKIITWGYWLRSQIPVRQTEEILKHFNLRLACQPLTRCLSCNGLITAVPKEAIADQLPPKTKIYFDQFFSCAHCRQVYWKGSHYDLMQKTVNKFLSSNLYF